jgi:four helix bundle protein
MSGNGYRDLKVWQKAINLVVLVYRTTQKFPTDERFALISQMQRAAVSVAANIAEGHGRTTAGEYRYSLSVARGSLKELETYCEIAHFLGYVSVSSRDSLLDPCTEISKMLTALKRNLRR